MSDHYCITVHKVGEETGRRLISATCGCGWKSGIWYGHEAYVAESFARHERAIEEGSTVPWMVASQGAA